MTITGGDIWALVEWCESCGDPAGCACHGCDSRRRQARAIMRDGCRDDDGDTVCGECPACMIAAVVDRGMR